MPSRARIAAGEAAAHELGAEGRVVDAVVAPEREHALGVAGVPGRQRLVQPRFRHLARHGRNTTGRSPRRAGGSIAAWRRILSAGVAYIDGEFVPIAEARLPILDLGFLRSDATYDVVAVWNGRFFRLDQHLDRFFGGRREAALQPAGRPRRA